MTAPEIFVCAITFGGPFGPRYTVLIDREYYRVNERTLELLRKGETPADLDLDPEPEDEEDDYCHSDDIGRLWRREY